MTGVTVRNRKPKNSDSSDEPLSNLRFALAVSNKSGACCREVMSMLILAQSQVTHVDGVSTGHYMARLRLTMTSNLLGHRHLRLSILLPVLLFLSLQMSAKNVSDTVTRSHKSCDRVTVTACDGSECENYNRSKESLDSIDRLTYWCIQIDGRSIRRRGPLYDRSGFSLNSTESPYPFISDSFGIESSLTHEYANSDKIDLIDCLLQLRGDSRISGACFMTTSPLSSQLWTVDYLRHSVQVEALFLIRLLLCDPLYPDGRKRSWGCGVENVPSFRDMKADTIVSISSPKIERAFDLMREWFTSYLELPPNERPRIEEYPAPSFEAIGLQWTH